MGWKKEVAKKAAGATKRFVDESLVPAFKRGFGGKLKAIDEAGMKSFEERAAARGTGKLKRPAPDKTMEGGPTGASHMTDKEYRAHEKKWRDPQSKLWNPAAEGEMAAKRENTGRKRGLKGKKLNEYVNPDTSKKQPFDTKEEYMDYKKMFKGQRDAEAKEIRKARKDDVTIDLRAKDLTKKAKKQEDTDWRNYTPKQNPDIYSKGPYHKRNVKRK